MFVDHAKKIAERRSDRRLAMGLAGSMTVLGIGVGVATGNAAALTVVALGVIAMLLARAS